MNYTDPASGLTVLHVILLGGCRRGHKFDADQDFGLGCVSNQPFCFDWESYREHIASDMMDKLLERGTSDLNVGAVSNRG